jgi:hypothetical protein
MFRACSALSTFGTWIPMAPISRALAIEISRESATLWYTNLYLALQGEYADENL